MNRFTKTSWKKKLISNFPLSLVIFALVFIGFIYGVSTVADSDIMNEKQILEEAVHRDIVHCYAIEGSYPASLSYMEEHYGLTYDKDKFIIRYENIGGNIMPSVTIIER